MVRLQPADDVEGDTMDPDAYQELLDEIEA
jgi:hypothetical protein